MQSIPATFRRIPRPAFSCAFQLGRDISTSRLIVLRPCKLGYLSREAHIDPTSPRSDLGSLRCLRQMIRECCCLVCPVFEGAAKAMHRDAKLEGTGTEQESGKPDEGSGKR